MTRLALADEVTEVERAILQRVKQDAEYAQQARATRASRWRECRRWYDSEWTQLDTTRAETALFVPQTRTTVARMVTAMLAAFFGQNESRFAKATARTTEGMDPEVANIMQQVLNYHLDECMPIYTLWLEAFQCAFVDEMGPIKLTWDRQVGAEAIVRNKPLAENVPLEDLLIDPFPREAQNIRFIIHWREVDLDELWDMQDRGIYRNVEKVQATLEAAGAASKDGFERTALQETHSERRTAEVFEYWGRLQLLPETLIKQLRIEGQNVPPQDVMVTTFDNKVILAGPTPNPYASLRPDLTPLEKLPFVLPVALPEKGSFWGTSVVWLMRFLQREINMIRSERRDNVILELNPRTLYNRNSGVDIEVANRARKGGFIPTDELENTFREWQPGNVTQSAYREEEINRRDRQALTGVTDYNEGMNRPGMTDTATGISILTEQANLTFANYAQNLKKTGIVPFLKKLADYAIQWVEPEELKEILGSLSMPPPLRQMVTRRFDVSVDAGLGAASKAVETRNLEYALQTVGQIAQLAPDVAGKALMLIVQKLLPLLGIHDVAQQLQGGTAQGGGPPGAQGAQMGLPAPQPGVAGQVGAVGPSLEETRGLV